MHDFGVPDTGTFTFRLVPTAMPPDQRLSWRLPVLLLLLKHVRSGKASFKRLAIAAFALNRDDDRIRLGQLLDDERSLDEVPTRYEPALPALLNIGAASGLLAINGNGNYELTAKGKSAADVIETSGGFEEEISFLTRYGKKLSEAAINRILERGIVPQLSE
jgi:hypothetical protein